MSESSNEITVKEIIQKGLFFFNLLLKNYLLIGLFGVLFVVLGVFTRGPKTYTASTSILLTSEKLGGGTLMGLASQFGFGGDEAISFDKFQSIANSQLTLKKVLRTPIKVSGETKMIGDHILDISKMREDWSNSGKDYLANVDLNSNSAACDTVMLRLVRTFKDWIEVSEEKGKLTYVKVKTLDEDLSIGICNAVVKETTAFFTQDAVKNDLNTLNVIESRLDSVRNELYANEVRYSEIKDQSVRTVKTKGLLEIMRVERNIRILNEIFVEATKQHEVIQFKILNNHPSIQVIDRPAYPIEYERQSLIIRSAVFGIGGGILASLFIIGRFLLREFKLKLEEESN